MFLWTCYRVDKLKIILFHDFNAVASLNINQPTSSESSAAFMDQNNTYPLNDFPMLDYTALLDIEVSTPDFTLKMITLSFHYQPFITSLLISKNSAAHWIQDFVACINILLKLIEILNTRFLVGRKKTSLRFCSCCFRLSRTHYAIDAMHRLGCRMYLLS